MRFNLYLFISLIVSANCLFSQSIDSNYINQINTSRGILQRLIRSEKIPGLSITITKENKKIWSEGFGFSNIEKKKIVKPESTLFRIASISKPITATGLGTLSEDKFLDLDKSIYQYIPDFPKKKTSFTLRHLANHSSGVRHYRDKEFYNMLPLSIEEGINIFKNDSLSFIPGQKFLYSSYGWNLISYVIQKKMNTPFENFISDSVFKPLKMNNTFPEINGNDSSNISLFYHKSKEGKIYIAKEVNNFYKFASGGFLSTTEDLVKFGNSYLNNDLLNKKTIEDFTHFQIIGGLRYNYGLGWQLLNDESNVLKSFYHVGKGVGGYGLLIVYPKEKIVISLLANVGELDLEKEVFSMSKIFLNL